MSLSKNIPKELSELFQRMTSDPVIVPIENAIRREALEISDIERMNMGRTRQVLQDVTMPCGYMPCGCPK